MSLDDKNLTTDAAPDGPRKNITPLVTNVNSEPKSNNKPTLGIPLNKNKKSPPKQPKPKKQNGTNFYVVKSSQVHIGAVNNFNYCASDSKCTKPEENIVFTEEIKRLLSSKTVLSKEHINIISTHLGSGWRDVGLALGYSSGQLDNFYEDNKALGNKEVVYQMLLDWIQMKVDEATIGELTTILWHLDQKNVVKQISIQ